LSKYLLKISSVSGPYLTLIDISAFEFISACAFILASYIMLSAGLNPKNGATVIAPLKKLGRC